MNIKLIFGLLSTAMILAGCDKSESAADTAAMLSSSGGQVGPKIELQDRFRVVQSKKGHAETLTALLTALDRRDLTVFAVIDHAAGAQSVDLDLPASTLVIFGAPRAGTPLMNAEPLMGAELPLRALVYERGDKTFLAVTGMGYLERTYNLQSVSSVIDRIADSLDAIMRESTSS